MQRTKRKYCFHNPNADGVLEKYILQLVMEQSVKWLLAAWKSGGSDRDGRERL